ncbi:MAG: hypothetical protein FRX49_05176 [Trebouxia sp. A1-2]|nr:MAG: hypothetical protein FRX49_05176 [Trebouxia sp. A1-2]
MNADLIEVGVGMLRRGQPEAVDLYKLEGWQVARLCLAPQAAHRLQHCRVRDSSTKEVMAARSLSRHGMVRGLAVRASTAWARARGEAPSPCLLEAGISAAPSPDRLCDSSPFALGWPFGALFSPKGILRLEGAICLFIRSCLSIRSCPVRVILIHITCAPPEPLQMKASSPVAWAKASGRHTWASLHRDSTPLLSTSRCQPQPFGLAAASHSHSWGTANRPDTRPRNMLFMLHSSVTNDMGKQQICNYPI